MTSSALKDLIDALTSNSETSRDAKIEAMLDRIAPDEREQIATWVTFLLPLQELVPDAYGAWRPLVTRALHFLVCRLSSPRLAPKLVEQADLSPDTPLHTRLIRLIARMPGPQKLGQVLARNRHLNPQLRAELATLENGMFDAAYAEIRAVLQTELAERAEEFQVEIAPQILSEASVSAVVCFTWVNPASGRRERGVFKVLKPHIPACLTEDLAIFREMAALLAESGDVQHALNEVCDLLAHEIDFRHEQETLARAAEAYRDIPGVRVPRLIRPLCSSVVTAMSEESGVKVVDAFAGDAELRRRVARQIVEALVIAPLLLAGGDRLFHADPHAGNMLYDEAGRELVLLDWALSETLTDEQVRQTALLILMLGMRDVAGVSAAIAALSSDLSGVSLHEHVGAFIAELPFIRLPGSRDAVTLLDRLALRGVRFPSALLMFRKVLFTIDGILNELAGPEVSNDSVIIAWIARHWSSLRLPFDLRDWIALQCSSLFYGPRLWLDALSNAV
ncbi:MAG TPA: AarF/UbiB family protein [Bryobacteraceae bacterium]|nr:AarF/UbiB family protein [Bryobacteraceae bacterium]